MCNVKPGPRCAGHAAEALNKAQSRYDQAVIAADAATLAARRSVPGDGEAELAMARTSADVDAAYDRLLRARMDYDSTSVGQAALSNSNDPADRWRYRAGKALAVTRREQERLMPSGGSDHNPAQAAAYKELQDARLDLAYAEAARAADIVMGDQGDGQAVEARAQAVDAAAARVAEAEASYSYHSAGGTPDWGTFSEQEAQAFGSSSPETKNALARASHRRAANMAYRHYDISSYNGLPPRHAPWIEHVRDVSALDAARVESMVRQFGGDASGVDYDGQTIHIPESNQQLEQILWAHGYRTTSKPLTGPGETTISHAPDIQTWAVYQKEAA